MYNQLATYAEAKEIANALGTIGGGVVDTYVPAYEGPYTPPENGDSKFLHFKFANGADGFNVGLIRAFMQNSPLRWPAMVSAEVEAARKVPTNVVPIGTAKPDAPIPAPEYCPIDFTREIQPGVFASTESDRELINAVWKDLMQNKVYQKRKMPNGMSYLIAWVLV